MLWICTGSCVSRQLFSNFNSHAWITTTVTNIKCTIYFGVTCTIFRFYFSRLQRKTLREFSIFRQQSTKICRLTKLMIWSNIQRIVLRLNGKRIDLSRWFHTITLSFREKCSSIICNLALLYVNHLKEKLVFKDNKIFSLQNLNVTLPNSL